MQCKRKLCFEKLHKMGYDKEIILQVCIYYIIINQTTNKKPVKNDIILKLIESEVNPCIGFTEPMFKSNVDGLGGQVFTVSFITLKVYTNLSSVRSKKCIFRISRKGGTSLADAYDRPKPLTTP